MRRHRLAANPNSELRMDRPAAAVSNFEFQAFFRIAMVSAGALALTAVLAAARGGPTRVGRGNSDPEDQAQPIAYAAPGPGYPAIGPYGGWGYVSTPEIISRIGEILAAIDSPQDRSKLAQQWLQFSKQTIAKDQEYREAWLEIQRRQLVQTQQAQQYQLEIARLQMRIEELQAQNLRLEQENLQAQLQLSQRAGNQARTPQ